MQVVVLALPYIPEEDKESFASNIASAVITSIQNKNFEPLVNALSEYRNVLFPYETFRIKLVFIIFVNTQSLIGMGLDAVKKLLSPNGNPSAGRLYFISPVLNYMSYNIRENSTKVNNIINNLQTYIKDVSSVINSYQVCTRKVSYDGNKTFKEGGCTREIRCITKCVDKNCTKTVLSCTDTCSCNFNLDVNYKTLGSEGKAGDLGYRINLRREIYNNTLKSESRTCSYTFTPDDRSRRYFIDTFLNYYIPTPTQLKAVFTGYRSDNISEIRSRLYNSISNYFKKKIWFNTLSNNLCDLDVINKTISQRYREDIKQARGIIEREIRTANDLIVNAMRDRLNNSGVSLDEVDKVNEALTIIEPVVVSCIEEIITGAIVSSVPVAGQILALANGIVGALQKQVSITGSIQLPSDYLLKVTSPICRGGEIIGDENNDRFISNPSLGEAIAAGVLGFVSGLLRSFSSKAADLIDLIPIVREVDLPQKVKKDNTLVKYYYMTTSRPGVYNITISVNIRNLVDTVIDDIKTSITETLNDIFIIVSGNELIRVMGSALVLSIDNPYEIIKDQDIKKYTHDINTNSMLTLNVTVISVPPYTYGGVSGGVIRYSYGYDLTGLLRSGAVTLDEEIYTSLTTFENFVVDLYYKIVWIIVERLTKIMLEDISKIIEKKIPGADKPCSPKWIVLRTIMTVASNFVEKYVDTMINNKKMFINKLNLNCEGKTYNNLLNGFSLNVKSILCQQLELEETTCLAPYFLACKPVRPPESPTVRKCYGAVVTPYFTYKKPEVTQENFIRIILNNIDCISSDCCKGCGDSLLEILKKEGSLEYRFLFIKYSFGVSKEENKWRISLTTSFPSLLPLFPPLSVKWGVKGDAREVLTSDLFRNYLILLDKSSVRNKVFSEIQRNQFFNVLMSLAWDYRNVELPVGVGGFGVNLFFSAFRV
ncbi:MAG: hypothetical protein QXN04_11310, partial [Pyrobaculum sp.]